MKNKKTSPLLLVLLFVAIIAALTMASALNRQDSRAQEQRKAVEKRVHAEDYPIADYMSGESDDPRERAVRRARNRRYDLPGGLQSEDLNRFKLKDSDPEVLVSLAVSHAPAEPALPVVDSDGIIIAEVTDARAYLSNDRTSVYSEFTLNVSEVLKNGGAGSLSPGALIAAQRPGGRVRLQSGKVLLRGAPYGRNMPRLRQRYVFFLRQNDEGQDYSIITAYEIRDGRISPLDGSPEGSVRSGQFAGYEQYAGVDEAGFINHLRAAIEKGAQQ